MLAQQVASLPLHEAKHLNLTGFAQFGMELVEPGVVEPSQVSPRRFERLVAFVGQDRSALIEIEVQGANSRKAAVAGHGPVARLPGSDGSERGDQEYESGQGTAQPGFSSPDSPAEHAPWQSPAAKSK